jgi:hypothetical protein
MLTDTEDIEPDLVGQLYLLDHVAKPLVRAAANGLAERVDADLHYGAQ